jgi:hypothetical protein
MANLVGAGFSRPELGMFGSSPVSHVGGGVLRGQAALPHLVFQSVTLAAKGGEARRCTCVTATCARFHPAVEAVHTRHIRKVQTNPGYPIFPVLRHDNGRQL